MKRERSGYLFLAYSRGDYANRSVLLYPIIHVSKSTRYSRAGLYPVSDVIRRGQDKVPPHNPHLHYAPFWMSIFTLIFRRKDFRHEREWTRKPLWEKSANKTSNWHNLRGRQRTDLARLAAVSFPVFAIESALGNNRSKKRKWWHSSHMNANQEEVVKEKAAGRLAISSAAHSRYPLLAITVVLDSRTI